MGMKKAQYLILAAALLLTGCRNAGTGRNASVTEAGRTEAVTEVSEELAAEDPEEPVTEEKPEAESCRFEPHVYSGKLSELRDEKWWESFYNLVDAIRAGEDSFACSDEATYRTCINDVTLGDLYPVACVYVTGNSNDGTVPYENGVGRIYYTIPKDEFMQKRQAFEEEVDRILGETVKTDDTDFEKCLALYEYMTDHFTYHYGSFDYINAGANYRTLMGKTGICCELGGVYAYLLLECGVDAVEIQSNDDIYHAWTYIILDGQGYHSDVTWALREKGEPLRLKYFMETGEERANDGFDMSTLEIPLLLDENGWMVENVEYPAEDDRYASLWTGSFVELDKEKKVLFYVDEYAEDYDENEKVSEFHYGDEEGSKESK